MGYAGGSAVFNRIARTITRRRDIPAEAVTAVLADVAEALLDEDWDTVDESVQEFRSNEPVLAALAQAAPDTVEHWRHYWKTGKFPDHD